MIASRLLPDEELGVTTARLRLVPLVVADADDLFPVLDDASLYRFIGGAPPTRAELRTRFAKWEGRVAPGGMQLWLNWTVRLVPADIAVGYVQATVSEDGAIIAYVIGTQWSGMGIATEAVAGMCQILHRRVGVQRLVAHIHPEHSASSGVALCAGLTATGALDEDGEEVWMWTSEVTQ